MINKFKTFAIAMLATGATVATTSAAPVQYAATNVIQPVTVTLSVYAEKSGDTNILATGASASFNSADLLSAVTSALDLTVGRKAEVAVLTSNILVQIGTTNIATNVFTNVANSVAVNTNTYVIGSQTIATSANPTTTNYVTNNLSIGNTSGDYYLTVTATNGTNYVSATTLGINGPVVTTSSATNITLYADQTASVGTNAPIALETNVTLGSTPEPVDASSVTVSTNGTTVTNFTVGTNTLTISTNAGVIAVTLGTNVEATITNSTNATNVVLVGPEVLYSNSVSGASSGLGTSSSLATTLTSTFDVSTLVTNTTNSGVTNAITETNVTVVTTVGDLVTNTITVTNSGPVYGTNLSTEVVVVNGTTNYPVPTNVLSITTESSTNDIDAPHSVTYTIKRFILNGGTSNAPVDLKAQGLVKSTLDDYTVGAGKTAIKVAVTNEAWTDVSGYGTNGTTPFVVAGSAAVGSPSQQKIPKP